MNVHGVGEKNFLKLKAQITVTPANSRSRSLELADDHAGPGATCVRTAECHGAAQGSQGLLATRTDHGDGTGCHADRSGGAQYFAGLDEARAEERHITCRDNCSAHAWKP